MKRTLWNIINISLCVVVFIVFLLALSDNNSIAELKSNKVLCEVISNKDAINYELWEQCKRDGEVFIKLEPYKPKEVDTFFHRDNRNADFKSQTIMCD